MAGYVLRDDGQTIRLDQAEADYAFPTDTFTQTTGTISAGATGTFSYTFVKKAQLSHIMCFATNSTDFDVELYEKNDFSDNYRIYRNIDNSGTLSDQPIRYIAYKNEDGESKLNIKVINTDAVNNSNFTLRIKYVPIMS